MNWKCLTFLLTLLVVFSVWFYKNHPLSSTVVIANTKFVIELAITPDEKLKGLGGRKRLLPNHGMLFPYDHKERYDFWMKRMKFPLDFIWIADTTVVDITRNVQPPSGSDMHVVRANLPINKVLEINAGEVDAFGIKIGDTVTFNK